MADIGATPAEDVDAAPAFVAKATSLHASLSGSPNVAFAAIMLLLAVLLLLIRFFLFPASSSGGKGGAKRGKNALNIPFDVEGGTSPGGGKALHPAVAQAAATADVGALRDWLADERTNIDAQLAADGTTALHAAARNGHANVVRLLVEHGADTLVVDSALATPLHLVAMGGHGLCVKALLDVDVTTPIEGAGGLYTDKSDDLINKCGTYAVVMRKRHVKKI